MKTRQEKVAVIGVGMIPVVKSSDKTPRDLALEVLRLAINDAGITKDNIDGLFVTPPGSAGLPHFMFGCELGEYLQLPTKSMALLECGGCTASAALHYAIDEILLGRNKINVVIAIDIRAGMEIQPDPDEMKSFIANGVYIQSCLYGPFEALYGIGAPIPYYAMSAQRYMYEHGVSASQVAEVSVVLRGHASKNPYAEYRKEITREEVLNSHMISPPIHLLECSPFSTGASAIILASPDVAGDLKKDPVYITGIGEFHHPSHFVPLQAGITSFEAPIRASREAFADAGRSPDDVNVAEVYGVFAATELMLLEDLGFFEKGKAGRAFMDGTIGREGKLYVDPSGGRLSLGHPAMATPAYELTEIVLQLRGEAGERQMKDPRVGLVQAEHGMLNGSIVMILECD